VKWYVSRNVLRIAHLWSGLLLAIPFILLGLSGSLLMFQPEAPRWSLPYASTHGEQQSLEAITAAARASLPNSTATRLTMPDSPGEPVTVRFLPNDAQRGQNYRGALVFVDPVSLQILGQIERPRPAQFFNTMRTLHSTLYVRTISDRSFVGWMGIALTFMCISGIVLWWPKGGKWRNAFSVAEDAHGYQLIYDLHSSIGFWSLIILLIVSVSGLYLSFPRTFRETVGIALPLGQTFVEPGNDEALVTDYSSDLDLAVDRTINLVPQSELRDIQFATRPGGVMVLNLSPQRLGPRAPTITVSINPDTGDIAYIDDHRDYAVGERVVLWQRWLHSGLGLGIIWRVAVFISGFLPLFFATTGIWMWILKRNAGKKRRSVTLPAVAE